MGDRSMKKTAFLSAFICFVWLLASPAFAESYNWGFNKGKNGNPADAGKKLNEMLPKYDAIYKGDTSKKDIYLTFDNGYENGYTAKVLDVLKKHKAPGTFFITGHYLNSAPELVVRMAKEGHIIGNHSWNHPDMTAVTDDVIRTELLRVKEATEKLTGKKGMNYLRPPRGVFNERTMKIARDEGYYHIFWSLAYKDWVVDEQKGAAYAHDQVMKQIHPGAILLLHTVSKDNADALDSILTDLEKEGYTIKSLDDLMIEKQLPNRMLY
jgi:peptidoglycan-N-acetylmuramic acid deacetylase